MRSSATEDKDNLLHRDVIYGFLPTIGKSEWQTLYLNKDSGRHEYGVWCALLNPDAAARAVLDESWDLHIGDGRPGFCTYYERGAERTVYDPYGHGDGVRPLVHARSFGGAFPPYHEIDQEFRLFHNLAHDHSSGRLLDFDASGREVEVVRFAPDKVEAHLKYLRQFQEG